MFEIIVGEDILFDSLGETYTCGYWCRTSQGDFPGASWVDFAGILVPEWSQAIMSACRFPDARFRLMFMDGPYEIEGRRIGNDVKLDFYRNGSRGRVLQHSEVVSICELAQAMHRAVLRLKSALYLTGRSDAGDRLLGMALQWKRVLDEWGTRC